MSAITGQVEALDGGIHFQLAAGVLQGEPVQRGADRLADRPHVIVAGLCRAGCPWCKGDCRVVAGTILTLHDPQRPAFLAAEARVWRQYLGEEEMHGGGGRDEEMQAVEERSERIARFVRRCVLVLELHGLGVWMGSGDGRNGDGKTGGAAVGMPVHDGRILAEIAPGIC